MATEHWLTCVLWLRRTFAAVNTEYLQFIIEVQISLVEFNIQNTYNANIYSAENKIINTCAFTLRF